MKTLTKISLLALLAVVLFACTQPKQENMIQTFPENEALVRQYIDALIAGNMDVMESVLTDDFKSYGPKITDSTDRATTIEQWKNDYQNIKQIKYDRYAMLSVRIPEGRVAGDWVMDWGRVTFEYKDNTPSWTIDWHGVFGIANGKIKSEHGFYNEADIQRQLGFTITPPVPVETPAQ